MSQQQFQPQQNSQIKQSQQKSNISQNQLTGEIKFTRNLGIKNISSLDAPNYLKSKHINLGQLQAFQNANKQQLEQNQQSKACTMRKTGSFSYAISYEAPDFFNTKFSVRHEKSYKNPYLFLNNNQDQEYAKQVQLKKNDIDQLKNRNEFNLKEMINDNNLKKNIIRQQEPKITNAKLFNCATNTEKVVQIPTDNQDLETNTFQKNYQKIVLERKDSFNKKIGLFNDYIEKNQLQKVFGHLLKKDTRSGYVDFHSKLQDKQLSEQMNKSRSNSIKSSQQYQQLMQQQQLQITQQQGAQTKPRTQSYQEGEYLPQIAKKTIKKYSVDTVLDTNNLNKLLYPQKSQFYANNNNTYLKQHSLQQENYQQMHDQQEQQQTLEDQNVNYKPQELSHIQQIMLEIQTAKKDNDLIQKFNDVRQAKYIMHKNKVQLRGRSQGGTPIGNQNTVLPEQFDRDFTKSVQKNPLIQKNLNNLQITQNQQYKNGYF